MPHGARALLNVTALGDAITLFPKMFVVQNPEIVSLGHSKVTLTHHQPSTYRFKIVNRSWHFLFVMFMVSTKSIVEHFFNRLSGDSGHLFVPLFLDIFMFSSISLWSKSQFHFSA